MSKATINWDSAEAWKRLMASMFAAGIKPDLTEVAKFYGSTRGAIEWQLRQIKRDAKALEAEANGEPAPATPAKKKSSNAATPKSKSPLHSVASGRVSKTAAKKDGIKQESSNEEDAMQGDNSE